MHHVADVGQGGVEVVVFAARLDVEVSGHAVHQEEAAEQAACGWVGGLKRGEGREEIGVTRTRVLGLGEERAFYLLAVLGRRGGDLGVQVQGALDVGRQGLHRSVKDGRKE